MRSAKLNEGVASSPNRRRLQRRRPGLNNMAIVLPAARQAFLDMLVVAKEVNEQYSFKEHPEPLECDAHDVASCFCLQSNEGTGEILFAVSSPNPKQIGKGFAEEYAVQWPTINARGGGLAEFRKALLYPCWVIFVRRIGAFPINTVFGALVAGQSVGESQYKSVRTTTQRTSVEANARNTSGNQDRRRDPRICHPSHRTGFGLGLVRPDGASVRSRVNRARPRGRI